MHGLEVLCRVATAAYIAPSASNRYWMPHDARRLAPLPSAFGSALSLWAIHTDWPTWALEAQLAFIQIGLHIYFRVLFANDSI